jgi:glucan biosynthesis protein
VLVGTSLGSLVTRVADVGESFSFAGAACTGAAIYTTRLQPFEIDEIVRMAREFAQKDSEEEAEAELRQHLMALNYRVA